nr:hypothetical protein [uncultured Clostridium sp.]
MDKSFLDIIKEALLKFIETEKGTPDGIVNLFGGIICGTVVVGAISTDIFDKILSCIFKEYEAGMPWYAVVALIIGLMIFFQLCQRNVAAANIAMQKINDTTNNSI